MHNKLNAYQRFSILMSNLKADNGLSFKVDWQEVKSVGEQIDSLLREAESRGYFESSFHEESGLNTHLKIENDNLKEQIINLTTPDCSIKHKDK